MFETQGTDKESVIVGEIVYFRGLYMSRVTLFLWTCFYNKFVTGTVQYDIICRVPLPLVIS